MRKNKLLGSSKVLTALLLLLFPLSLFSAQTVTINNLEYTLGGDTAVVSGYVTKPTGALTIPATITEGGVSYQVTAIDEWVFYGCVINSISLPEGLTSIGSSAFRSCTMTSISMPESLTSIGSSAFSNCPITSISLPEGITSIGSSAFEGCERLTTISLPKGLTSIGNEAFSDCEGLTAISLPEGLTSIGNEAFSDCEGLTAISLPKGLTSIGEYAFYRCEGLTAISLPEGLTSIGEAAFSRCEGLTAFTVSEKNQHYSALDEILFNKDQSVLINYPINKAGSAYTIPTSVKTIGVRAFYRCEGLTTISLPEGLTAIGERAFYKCEGLTAISLPESLTSIGSSAFKECTSLEELYVPIATPIAIDEYSFYEVPTATCTLYVPVGSKALYQAAEYWQDFQNIVEKGAVSGTINTPESGVRVVTSAGSIVVEGAPQGVTIAVYTLSGQLVANTTNTEIELPQQGVYIVRIGNKAYKVMN